MLRQGTDLQTLMGALRSWSAGASSARFAAVWHWLLAGTAGLLLMAALPAQSSDRPVDRPPPSAVNTAARADFGAASPGPDARRMADWIARTHDHHGKGFFLIDKVNATLYVFDRHASLRASSPVLLGAALGDDSVPGIGDRPMAEILPLERTTPAGRFVAEVGRNHQGEDIVWVDYGAAVSMHRVRTGNAIERRAERLRTSTVDDNRISYGCINVPVAFYDRHVQAVFAASRTAVVYVLPEIRSLRDQFGLSPLPAPVAQQRP